MDYLQYSRGKATEVGGAVAKVLNLIINGLPSILKGNVYVKEKLSRFKPYYKWITFNTKFVCKILLIL